MSASGESRGGKDMGEGGDARFAISPELAFTKRWTAQLAKARDEGGWHHHVAGSQSGKTTANRLFVLANRPRKTVEGTSAPVLQVWATGRRQSILRDIAKEMGADAVLRGGNSATLIPALLRRCGTRLLIVNNGHQMEWRQWQDLLSLDDALVGGFGHRLAIVFSSVQRDLSKTAGLPREPELVEQIEKRLRCRMVVVGLSLDEIGPAVEALLTNSAPRLARTVADQGALIYRELTAEAIDPQRRGTVGLGDLVELLRRVSAAKKAKPEWTAAEAIRAAARRLTAATSRPSAHDLTERALRVGGPVTT